jgi:hypothetical protein
VAERVTSRYSRDLWLEQRELDRRRDHNGEGAQASSNGQATENDLERWSNDEIRRGGERWSNEEIRRGGERWSNEEIRRGGERWSNEEIRRSGERWSNEEITKASGNFADRVTTPVTRFDASGRVSGRPSGASDLTSRSSRGTSLPRTASRRSHAASASANSTRLAGLVWLAVGAGLCVDGCAVTLAWHDSPFAFALFWTAVLGPFVVFVVVLAALRPSPTVRQFTVGLVGLYPAVIYRMSSPFVLGGFDEHLHERTLNDLLHGSGLFAPNPLLVVGPYYPGLELFTGIITRLTGIPAILAMSLVVFFCRLILVLAIYHGAAAVTNSYRSGSLAVLFYAASPQFYFFNSQFSYQTMALALGLGGLVLLHRAQLKDGTGGARPLAVMATLALVSTVVTHHATSWIVLAFLIVWTVAAQPGRRKIVAWTTAAMAISVIAWTMLSIHRLSEYMGPIFAKAIQQVELGFGPHLFRDAAGTALPQWERAALIVYAILCTCAALICGWRVLRMAIRDGNRMLGLIGLLSLTYPITLAARFEPALGSYGDRASTFMFLPVALCCSIVIRGPKTKTHRSTRRVRSHFIGLVGAVSFAYLGGVIMGTGPTWAYLPGPYLVSADSRTQDPETLAAVQWAARHLHPGSRVVADRTPSDLLAAQARLWPVSRPQNGLIPAALFFKASWKSSLPNIVKGLDIQYIYVDRRLEDSLPHDGYYISQGETAGPVQISPQALAKFAHVRGITAVYHNGPITIYDTVGLGVAEKFSGFVGSRSMDLSEPLSAILGALAGALLVLMLFFRKRPSRTDITVHNGGIVGYGVAFVTVTIFVGGLLFGLRVMPRPAFTVFATAIITLGIVTRQMRVGKRIIPHMRLAGLVHPLVLLGTCAVVVGVFIAVHAGWTNEVIPVNQVLQATAGTHG